MGHIRQDDFCLNLTINIIFHDHRRTSETQSLYIYYISALLSSYKLLIENEDLPPPG